MLPGTADQKRTFGAALKSQLASSFIQPATVALPVLDSTTPSKGGEFVFPFTIRQSDVDGLGHVNNAKYD
jgi:acyl-ACP thioesterase